MAEQEAPPHAWRGGWTMGDDVSPPPLPPGRLSIASNRRLSYVRTDDSEVWGSVGSLGSLGSQGDLSSPKISPWARPSISSIEIIGLATEKEAFSHRCSLSCFSAAQACLESRAFSALMTFLTVFVLVGDDIRLVAFGPDADPVFDVVTILSLVLFTFELAISSAVKEDYFLGFWFVLDTIATVSLVFDITYVSEAMLPYPEIRVENVDGSHESGAVGQSEYARAARSARVGARVARLLRVVRLIRLSRIMKCFDCIFGCGRPKASSTAFSVVPGEGANTGEEELGGAESRVGKKLSEKTTQRVFILVLVMLMGTPQLDPGPTRDMLHVSAQYGAEVIYKAWESYELAFQTASSTQRQRLLRLEWETQLLQYIYYHNVNGDCPENAQAEQTCATSWNNKLCWVGYVMNPKVTTDLIDNAQEGYIKELRPNMSDWNLIFGSGDWRKGTTTSESSYNTGTIPQGIQDQLTRPWTTDCSESSARVFGVSLLPNLPCPRKSLRPMETTWYVPTHIDKSFFSKYMQGQFVFVFDTRQRVSMEAIMSMLQTVFIVIILGMGAFFFSKDTDNLVLLPIERMITNMQLIRKDPLYAIKLSDRRAEGPSRRHEDGEGRLKRRAQSPSRRHTRVTMRQRAAHAKNMRKKTTMETMVLENAIIKLGSLLALGFGEAGSEIIGKNLDDDNASVEVMIPGCKVEAIYGFCDIRNFTTVTEVLQEKTMVFVNQVAEIAHRIVDDHLGAANKNLGEAFLLVWRIGRYDRGKRSKIADLAVISFVQVMAALSRDTQLAEYREHPALLSRLPNFRVSLDFGLHLGWSIEGAIGSEFKIDASYLSPHVNIANLLQAETIEYGVTMLMSEPLVRFCSPRFRRSFRPIDHVKYQGLKTPMRLFTVDLDQEVLCVDAMDTDPPAKRMRNCANRGRERKRREKQKAAKMEDDFQVHHIFDTDKNIRRMRECYPVEFFQEFECGYLNYEAGEWSAARNVLERTHTMLFVDGPEGKEVIEDGPSRVLLDYMAMHDFQAPTGWPGYRDLMMKDKSEQRGWRHVPQKRAPSKPDPQHDGMRRSKTCDFGDLSEPQHEQVLLRRASTGDLNKHDPEELEAVPSPVPTSPKTRRSSV